MAVSTTKPLTEIAHVIRGVSYKSGEAVKSDTPSYTPVLRAGNIQSSLEVDDGLVWVPDSKVSDKQRICADDILMCMSSGSANLVGKVARAERDWAGSFGAFCGLIRPRKEKINPSYLYHFLSSPIFKSWTKQSAGIGIKNIRKSELEGFKVPVPDSDDQLRIAAVLDKADEIRRKRQQAIDMVDKFLRSIFLDTFGDPATNPKEWEIGTIRDLVEEARYGTSSKASAEGEFEILRMGNITYEGGWDFSDMKRIDIPDKDREKYLVGKGDLLFNRTNSKELVGKTAVYREDKYMAFAGYLVRMRTNGKGSTEYVSAYINSNYGKQILRSKCKSIVGMANINAQEFQDIPIMLAPVDLQQEFGEKVIRVLAFREKLKESAKDSYDLFSSLSQNSFNGEL